MIKIIHTYV